MKYSERFFGTEKKYGYFGEFNSYRKNPVGLYETTP
jgi:hypothetical protein